MLVRDGVPVEVPERLAVIEAVRDGVTEGVPEPDVVWEAVMLAV